MGSNKLIVGVNDLQSRFPKLAEEWDYERNYPFTPDKVAYSSNRKVWWRCSKHPEHEWEASINSRTNMNNGCPICSGQQVLAGYNDLASLQPDLAAEWHPTKNGDLKPSDVTLHSGKKVWWRCSKHPDHEWESSINARTSKGYGCPICSGQQVLAGYNDLASLQPDLAAEWHPTKNGGLKPSDVTLHSHKKVWWRCSKHPDHEWEESIGNRTNGNGCPICSGHQVLAGFNDLATLRPDLAAEWHPTKNGDLKPSDVTLHSGKKVWWRCSKHPDHEWESTVNHRTGGGNSCPICSGHQVLAGFNDLVTLRPDLAAEWHPTKNGDLKPSDVTLFSNKKVWWRCSKHPEHEWEASVANRTNGKGCPICSGQQVLAGYNDLATLRPDLTVEWHPTKNGGLKPSDVTLFSQKKVWWICSKHPEHEWESTIHNRTRGGNGCPICAGKQVLKGFNDLATLRPDLTVEWHPTKNGGLKPSDVTLFSGKKVWWRCSKHPEHEWKAFIYSRTNMNSGCPICAKERMVSFPEKIIAYYLKKVLPIRENIFIDRWNVDILAGNVVIEYDGEYFHSKSVEKDNLKNKDLESEGYTVIRILGKAKSDYVKLSETRYEICELNYDHFKQLISDLCTYLKISCPDVDVERDREKIKELLD